jgi:hypothetical protein
LWGNQLVAGSVGKMVQPMAATLVEMMALKTVNEMAVMKEA